MNQVRAESAMSTSAGLERRIWLLTVTYAEDKSKRMRTDKLDKALVALRDPVTMRRAVSVE